MLVLSRKEGDWVDVKHVASGDLIRIRTYRITEGYPSKVDLAFDDDARHFAIERPERSHRPEAAAPAA